MSERDDAVYLEHMRDTARRIVTRAAGLTRADFDEDEDLRLALVHLVQTIGEAARHVSAKTREAHPSIPWRRIVGMRHKVVHDYMHVDEDAVWRVVIRQASDLLAELEKIVPPEHGA